MPVAQPGPLAQRATSRPRPRVAPARGVARAPSRPARPALAAAVAAPAPAAPPGGAGSSGGFDYSSDPILQQARAIAQRNIATAEGSLQASRTQALIDYGYDPGLSSLYGDANTAGAAKGNPFSMLARLASQHEQRARSQDENLNKGNLFYSSYRGQQIQKEGTQYLGEQASAAEALRAQLSGYSDQLAGVKSSEQDRTLSAEEAAYQRALDQALRYGYGSGGGGARGAAPAGARPTRPRAAPARPGARVSRPRPAGRQP